VGETGLEFVTRFSAGGCDVGPMEGI